MKRTFILTLIKYFRAVIQQLYFYGNKKNKQNSSEEFAVRKFVSTQSITKNIEVFCWDHTPPSIEKPFTAENPSNRTLIIILEWIAASQKHVMKYANFYLDQNFDVLKVSLSPSQLIWPAKGSKVVTKDLLTFLHLNTGYQRVFIHGFSVGAYMWGEFLQHVHADSAKYNHVIEKIVGQVWDSIGNISEMYIGISTAVFPNNQVMQKFLQNVLENLSKMFNNQAMQYYIQSSQCLHLNPVPAPALFFVSNSDPIGLPSASIGVQDMWNDRGVSTRLKIFNNSPHVGHYYMYPKEYLNELNIFLDELNLSKNKKIN